MRSFMAGKEAEFEGVRMRSSWIGNALPIYISAHGPKTMQLAGEIGDGVISVCTHPVYVEWQLKQVRKGAERAGRDYSKIDTWARTMIYVADSKAEARRETSAYPSSYADLWSMLQRDDQDIKELKEALEADEPGSVQALINDSKTFAEALDPELAERVDAPHSKVVSQRLIDFYHISGTASEIRERIERLGALGIKTVSMTAYTLIDKKAMFTKVGNQIIPYFSA